MKKQGGWYFHSISILQIFWGFWCCWLTFGVLIFWSISYQNFTFELLAQYNRLDKLATFRADFLSIERFWVLRWAGLVGVGVSWIVLFWRELFEKITDFLTLQFSFFGGTLKAIWDSFHFKSSLQRCSCLGLLLSFHIPSFWQVLYFPLMLDEVFSYIHFVRNGMGVTMTYYPGPNNHIFFNLQAVLCDGLIGNWFDEPVLSLRLVSWFYGLVGSFLLFAWLRRFFGLEKALWGIALLQNFPPFFLYHFLGRGYMMQWFIILVGIWATLRITENENPSKIVYYYLIWVLSAWVGFYTIPTFLYPFVGMTIFLGIEILRKNFVSKDLTVRNVGYTIFSKSVLYLFVAQFAIILGVVLLYFPMFILGSGQSLLANDWIRTLSFGAFFRQLPQYGLLLVDFFTPQSIGFGLIIWLGIWIRLWSLKNLALPRLLLCISILPFFILLVQRVLPFERVWMYQTLVMVWGVLWILSLISHQFFVRLSLLVFIIWYGILCFQSYYRDTYQTVYQQVALEIWENKAQKIFANEDTYQIYIQYEYLKRQQNIEIISADFDDNTHYDYLLFSKKQLKGFFYSEKYKLIFENQEIRLWKKK